MTDNVVRDDEAAPTRQFDRPLKIVLKIRPVRVDEDGSLWSLACRENLAQVLRPGFFETKFEDYVLRAHDRINVACSLGGDAPEYAVLVVTSVIDGAVTVRRLGGEV